jgi:Uma2 family endonuclease
MVATQNDYFVSPEDYQAGETLSSTKHEYINGQVYAMAGANDAHVTVAGNLFALLRNHVRGKDCRAYMSDMKAHIDSLNIYYYPDVMVTCDARDRELSLFKRYPCLIVEVLSASTEAFDRGDKFTDYQHLESLQEYVLISPKRQRVECFRRNTEGLWVLHPFNQSDEVHLVSLNFRIGIDALYEDVIFASETQDTVG